MRSPIQLSDFIDESRQADGARAIDEAVRLQGDIAALIAQMGGAPDGGLADEPALLQLMRSRDDALLRYGREALARALQQRAAAAPAAAAPRGTGSLAEPSSPAAGMVLPPAAPLPPLQSPRGGPPLAPASPAPARSPEPGDASEAATLLAVPPVGGASGRSREAPSPVTVEALLGGGLAPSWSRAEQSSPGRRSVAAADAAARLAEIVTRLGEPQAVPDAGTAGQELRRLLDVSAQIDRWNGLPPEDQQALVGVVTCRARHLQDECDALDDAGKNELDAVFSALTAFSKREQPGFVVGLSRKHRPVGATWVNDARTWWTRVQDAATASSAPRGERNAEKALLELEGVLDAEPARGADRPAGPAAEPAAEPAAAAPSEPALDAFAAALDAGVAPDDPRLVRLAIPWLAALEARARFKALRKAARAALADDEAADAAEPDLPPDWPLFPVTQGRRAIILGGEPREEARQRLQNTFRFEDLDWVSPSARTDSQMEERIRSGRMGFVIVLNRFNAHKTVDKVVRACKESGTPWAAVERGYGVNAVRLAIERYQASRTLPP